MRAFLDHIVQCLRISCEEPQYIDDFLQSTYVRKVQFAEFAQNRSPSAFAGGGKPIDGNAGTQYHKIPEVEEEKQFDQSQDAPVMVPVQQYGQECHMKQCKDAKELGHSWILLTGSQMTGQRRQCAPSDHCR